MRWYAVVSPLACGNIILNILHYVIVFSILIFQDGWTALMLASLEGRTDIVELLIKHNADVNAREEVGLHVIIKT